jgi:hypothetical protein
MINKKNGITYIYQLSDVMMDITNVEKFLRFQKHDWFYKIQILESVNLRIWDEIFLHG